jgi:tRNA(Ile)-lysidine synthase
MSLVEKFKAYIHQNHLFTVKDDLLVAVSGGCDSIVLAYLLKKTGFNFSIAHCNFQLRGEESTRDEQLVQHFCSQNVIPFYGEQFETTAYAAQHKLSVQEAARALRYEYFNALINSATQQPFRFILTAHHANDTIETVLMNFFRGTGVQGLRGIQPKQQNIIRPLLFATRAEIENYAADNNIDFITDSSNESSKYSRNFIRNEVLPLVSTKYEQVEQNILHAIDRFTDFEKIYIDFITTAKQKLIDLKGTEIHIPILKLQQFTAWQTVYYEIIKEYGFAATQLTEAIKILKAENSKYIASATHKLVKNRNWIIITPNENVQSQFIIIEATHRSVNFENGTLNIETFTDKALELTTNNNKAILNAALISFPLILRKWKEGDYFYPLGMPKKKKVARFLIDLKLSKPDKEKVWVLESDKKIIWVVGYRIDDRVKMTHHTPLTIQLLFVANTI